LLGTVLNRFGGPPVGTDTERIACPNFQQVSGFGQQLRNGFVVHEM
jgi:hypothetical protein